MSYEYRLIFSDASSARYVMDVLKASTASIKGQGQEIYLKDAEFKSSSGYDARLIQEDQTSFWLEINFRCHIYIFCQKTHWEIEWSDALKMGILMPM